MPDGLKDVGTRVAAHMQKTNEPVTIFNKGKKKDIQQKVPFDKNIVTALQKRCNSSDENSIQSLHDFVHNHAIIPKEAQLRSLWNDYQLIIAELWREILEHKNPILPAPATGALV